MSVSVGPKLACIRKRAASSAVGGTAGGARVGAGAGAGAGGVLDDEPPPPQAASPAASEHARSALRAERVRRWSIGVSSNPMAASERDRAPGPKQLYKRKRGVTAPGSVDRPRRDSVGRRSRPATRCRNRGVVRNRRKRRPSVSLRVLRKRSDDDRKSPAI